jgi:Domain of unknown function (DUF1906)
MSFAGFDTDIFPGLASMQTWRESSPFAFAGYYLTGPCHGNSSWLGNWQALKDQGWGLAVLYVGQQGPAGLTGRRCTHNTLTDAQGVLDAQELFAVASSEGLLPGTRVFLDVELIDPNDAADQPNLAPMQEYFRAWIRTLLQDEDHRYVPGLYCHLRNANDFRAAAVSEFDANEVDDEPALWVAGGKGFDFTKEPGDSGFARAHVWQGVLDTDQTFGGTTLRIDINVAASPNPSGV